MFFCFLHLICIEKLFLSLCLFRYSLVQFTHTTSFHFQYFQFLFPPHLFSCCHSCFPEQVPLSLPFVSTFWFLFIVNCRFPPFLLYLWIYLLSQSLLLWACWSVHFTYMLLCNILEVEAYFHGMCTSGTLQFPTTISIHLTPTFYSSHDCF